MKDGSINIQVVDKAVKQINALRAVLDRIVPEEEKLKEFGFSLEIKGEFKL